MEAKKEDIVTNYWLKYYADEHCTLCGNLGIIDTRGIKTTAGIEIGRINYCICPNGQARRKQSQKEGSNAKNR